MPSLARAVAATVTEVIPLHEARDYVLDRCRVLPGVETSFLDTPGRVLARDVVATEDVPPFANTAMDGFAVRSADVTSVPVELRVVGTIAAGDDPELRCEPGTAVRIMTGAVIPDGADAVVMLEDTESPSPQRVVVRRAVASGTSVRPVGDDVRTGDLVFAAGTVVGPAGAGVLASINARTVLAHPPARVALLSTGDELVVDGSPLRRGQIRESNLTSLHNVLLRDGCNVVNLGIVADDEAELERVLRDAASRCDAIVTSGGVSVGDFDVVKAVLSRIATMRWMQLAIKPAKPFAFGELESPESGSAAGDRAVRIVPVFGLPGNPVSSLISYELLARPALRKMMGHRNDIVRPVVRAVADTPLRRKADGKVHYMRVFAEHRDDGRLHVRDAGPQGSHQLAATALANALAVVHDGTGIAAGDDVEVIWPF